jgi:hypothetical protein
MRPISASLIALAAAAVLSVGGWIALNHYQPEIPDLIHYLLSQQPAATGCWLLLSVVGIDYALTATRDTIGYRNVGSKARTHWRLTGGDK